MADVFRHAPDPRDRNTHYRIGPVLTIIAMALLAGRRDIAEIARFATRLTQPQRRQLAIAAQEGIARFLQSAGLRRLLRSAHAHGPGGLRRTPEPMVARAAPARCPKLWLWMAK